MPPIIPSRACTTLVSSCRGWVNFSSFHDEGSYELNRMTGPGLLMNSSRFLPVHKSIAPERPKFTLLRPARPGLLNQKRQVVNPILLADTARIDHVREVIFAVGEYKIGVRHGVTVA